MASTNNPTPFAYRAGRMPAASDPEAVNAFLIREHRNLERVIDGLLDYLPRDAKASPDNPRSGMIRRAVAPWRPVTGQTTDRWVTYNGSNWVYLS